MLFLTVVDIGNMFLFARMGGLNRTAVRADGKNP
jgi:hypothetical protein